MPEVGYTSAVTMLEPSVRDEGSVARISRLWFLTVRPAAGLLLAAVVALSAGCKDAPKSAERPPEPVKVTPVVQRDVPIYAEWVGTTVGYVTAQIRARVAGYLISQKYKEGTLVKAGDLLFEIDPRPYQIALNQARAQLKTTESQLEQSRAQVAQAEADLQRAEDRKAHV